MFLRKPKVLILDEPTSALDPNTSNELAQRLRNFAMRNDMIIIVISHKDDFDRIATLELEIKKQTTMEVNKVNC